MKGITPVIAIILLLMITVSLVGFTFVWFQRMTNIMQNKTQENLEQQQRQASLIVFIDNVNAVGGQVTVRNGGSVSIKTNEIAVYVNGTEYVGCNWGTTTEIQPNNYAICSNDTIKNCATIKVTAGTSFDVVNC